MLYEFFIEVKSGEGDAYNISGVYESRRILPGYVTKESFNALTLLQQKTIRDFFVDYLEIGLKFESLAFKIARREIK